MSRPALENGADGSPPVISIIEDRYAVVSSSKHHFVDFEVHQVISNDPGPVYSKGSCVADGLTGDVAEAVEPLVTGYVKWDGCCELSVDSHTCGAKDLGAMLCAITYAYSLGRKLESCDEGLFDGE